MLDVRTLEDWKPGSGCEVSVSNRTCGLSLEGRKQSLIPAMERVLAELTAPWLRVFIF